VSQKGKELSILFESIINFGDEIKNNNEFLNLSIHFWKLFYEIFSFRDCLTIIGIRNTPGSADFFPIKLKNMLEGFSLLNSVINDKNKNDNQAESKNIIIKKSNLFISHF